MRQLRLILLVAACFAGFAEARAEGIGHAVTGITYFNRTGATAEEHQAALDRCASAVRAMSDPNIMLFSGGATYNAAYSPAANAGAALVLMMVDAARVSAAVERAENTHYQNCMVAQGWRVMRLENNVGRRMVRMRQAELAAQLAPMIAAVEPEGVLAREFNNDLAHPGLVTPVPTGDGRFISLSRLALPSESAAAERRRQARRMPSQQTREEAEAARAESRRQLQDEEVERALAATPEGDPAVAGDKIEGDKGEEPTGAVVEVGATEEEKPPGGGLSAEELSALPQDATLVVYRQRGVRGGIVFRRNDSEEQESFVVGVLVAPAPVRGRSDDSATLEDSVVVIVVPPGRWRMESMFVGNLNVSLCMGSPAFDISAGEVVYAGDFNFGADPFVPGMSLTAAQDKFLATPHFADRLRAASYRNGSTGTCGPAQHLYAYEVPAGESDTTAPPT